jgi:hypothetical protein
VRSLRQARQQLSGFLLRHGFHYHRTPWTSPHRRWLAGLKFDQAMHYIVLEDYIAAEEAAKQRRDRLEAQITAALPEWCLAPLVEALQALRGIALVAAATLVAELGDITRFGNPRQLMAYIGLVPSEHSSGRSRRQGGITKAGNAAARRMLVEAAWSYRFPARISREQLLQQDRLAKPIRDIAWKAQERLCLRYRKLARLGKLKTVICTAIARELTGFVWAIATEMSCSAAHQRRREFRAKPAVGNSRCVGERLHPDPISVPSCTGPIKARPFRVAAKGAASLDTPGARRRRDLAVGTKECSRRGSNQRIDPPRSQLQTR